ncbi:MAG: universal stress protein, partial [Holophagales bacterium]|nr:universal stress protein [Holophagales bacterium]
MVSLVRDGCLPAVLGRHRSERQVAYLPLALIVIATGALATRVDAFTLAAVASLTILWASLALAAHHVRKTARHGPRAPFQLPWHPWIPVAGAALALFLSLILPRPVLGIGSAWTAVGALFYVAIGRRGSADAARWRRQVGELAEVPDLDRPRVLVAVGSGPSFDSLVRLGRALARHRGAELAVLEVELLLEQLPYHEIQESARATWQRLDASLGSLREPGDARSGSLEAPEIHAVVRLAPTIADGILDAARELGADLLVLGWPEERTDPGAALEPVVEKVFPATALATVVVRGPLPKQLRRVLVASAGGPHAPMALEVAEALAPEAESAALINVVTPRPARAEAVEALKATRDARRDRSERAGAAEPDGAPTAFSDEVVHAATVAEGLSREAGVQDVLLLGASVDRLLEQTVLGGFA